MTIKERQIMMQTQDLLAQLRDYFNEVSDKSGDSFRRIEEKSGFPVTDMLNFKIHIGATVLKRFHEVYTGVVNWSSYDKLLGYIIQYDSLFTASRRSTKKQKQTVHTQRKRRRKSTCAKKKLHAEYVDK